MTKVKFFGGRIMGHNRDRSRGFTLIAALLLTVLLSGIAVGLLYMVSNETRMGGNDLAGNMSYYAAEAGIENLTSLLSQTYNTSQSPTAATLNPLTNAMYFPTAVSGASITGVTYTESINWPVLNGTTCALTTTIPPTQNPCSTYDIVGAGPDAGMVAQTIPFTLTVTATEAGGSGQVAYNSSAAATGASTTMSRTVEVALLPAFEFGIFCDGDCDYFAGPPFNFGGRVHTNGNLFLAANSGPLTFTDKMAAVGQVILSQLENGTAAGTGASSYDGTIYVPDAASGCPAAPGAGPATYCLSLTQGSWTGGFPPTGSANSGWQNISTQTFHDFIINGQTGATKLQLPFVNSSSLPAPVAAIDIIHRPQASDSTALTQSRLFYKAEIHILLADQISDLHPWGAYSGAAGGSTAYDADDVQLTAGGFQTLSAGAGPGAGKNMYYAEANTTAGNGWVAPTGCTGVTTWSLFSQVTGGTACSAVWIRVEYKDATDTWHGVTRQWLEYGFGRYYDVPPTAPWQTSGISACGYLTAAPKLVGTAYNVNGATYPTSQCYNPISPAILILQQLQVNKGNTSANGGSADTSAYDTTGASATNWIPINFYDAREGEPRDNGSSARTDNYATSSQPTTYTPCSPSGVMNAVELDVGNLWLWLQHGAGGPYSAGSGNAVNNTDQSGYIIYFSDHRGMRADPHAPYTSYYNGMSGGSGLEDTINSGSTAGVPDSALETPTYYSFSPEDINDDGYLDNQGEMYLGAGFGLTTTYMGNPYFPSSANPVTSPYNTQQVDCNTSAYSAGTATTTVYVGTGSPQNNMVTGPRHVLRLVDGGMNGTTTYLPNAGSTSSYGDGFTVASEEPVYVLGDYNTGLNDPFWPSEGNPSGALHSAAAVIADAVTLLSNPPSGLNSPTTYTGWEDAVSFLAPGDVTVRNGNTSYYRVAIAAGKSIPFPKPGFTAGPDFGTDGGMHNFLRYLETRGYNGAVVNYAGSMISMYYSQYATGTFKCCDEVYGAPQRNYFFDTQFQNPNNLPPGTPMFQDVVSLSSHQSYSPQ